jgi:hypothetical protein
LRFEKGAQQQKWAGIQDWGNGNSGELLQGRAGFTAQKVALFDLFVAAAADQGDLDNFFGGVTPAVVLDSHQLAAIAPCVRKRVAVIVKVAEKAEIFSVNQMFADESLVAHSMLVTANRCHRHLKNVAIVLLDHISCGRAFQLIRDILPRFVKCPGSKYFFLTKTGIQCLWKKSLDLPFAGYCRQERFQFSPL